ncbi:MAG: HAD family hydrolase [Lachnospiraceae bacterium]|nr:HAD family hydrolase [Lachnospiraceae bacterium]
MIKNLIFDVDGTIWNSTKIVARGWNRAVAEMGCSKAVITPEILQREFGQPMDVIADHLFGDVEDMEKRQALLDKCCVYEQKLLLENEEDISYPGMREGMNALSKKYHLYIVSNCQCGYIELVMRKNGITHLIEDFECFGNTGTCKGETIGILMERNGIPKDSAVYIGDTKGDFEAAAIAGIPFIFAAYGFGTVEEAEFKAAEFAEIDDAVSKCGESV